MQKWGFFSMGIMAGIIVVLLSALLMQHRNGRARIAQIALYLATAAVYADIYITQPILPLLSHEFGVPPARYRKTLTGGGREGARGRMSRPDVRT